MAEKESSPSAKAAQQPAEDEELNELLADALNDFGKPPPEKSSENQKSKELDAENKPPNLDFSTEEFNNFEKDMLKALAANFQEDMQEVLSQTASGLDQSAADEFNANLRKMAEATAKAWSDQGMDSDFAATISETLKNLSEGAENLQNVFPDENLLKMLGPMGMPGEGTDEMLPFIQNMMQSLLSKEILYPALKDLLDKYDTWLNENESKLEESEVSRYRKQQILITQVCSVLESESESDSSEVKKQRFDSLINLMHQVQDCGQPPKDLMDSIKTFEEFPNPSDPSQCTVM
ncbi:hypothetical protein R5R35_001917 [Gryllus longicercus]|uniref:Peroxin-19 n=1 Tax=Gryllus longicercus TaxID=2509291 RepID=A0AAN9VNU3_9ORTH